MSEREKLSTSHLRRAAFVYVRQSTQAQTERNTESTERQYALVTRATELGFAREQVVVIDEDLGISGSGEAERQGFAAWRLKSRWVTPGWCWGSRFRVWPATTPTGTGCLTSAG